MRAILRAMAWTGGLCSGATSAQDILALSDSQTFALQGACEKAELDCIIEHSFHDFVSRLTGRDWPLVVIEWYRHLPSEQREVLLPALRSHLAHDGRLLLMYTHLDDWPELQELVAVRTTGDVLSIRDRPIWSVDPPHPVWSGRVSMSGFEDLWLDNGDFLAPGPGGYTLARWHVPEGEPAMAITRAGRIMVNGFGPDGIDGSLQIQLIVGNQLKWLLGCQADLDGDGELTFFDFLAFQNLFVAGDPRADFAFDGQLDLFDFLEFQDQFSLGCD